MEMEKTSDFAGDAVKQGETQYYHRYETARATIRTWPGTAGTARDKDVEAGEPEDVFAS